MLQGREITVLGAGIAGLAVATALAQRGARVQILEQAPEIREVGAGLQISPNGFRVLAALGLGTAAQAQSQATQAVELLDGETGQRVTRIAMDRFGAEGQFRLFHRADLIGLLERAARDAGVEILLGRKVEEVTLTADWAVIQGSGGSVRTELVIGADGLHSRLRAALNGEAKPFFTGQIAWRATLPAEGAIDPVARVYMGAGRHLVTYPLRGGQLRNIVAIEERAKWVEESWSLTDDPLGLRIAFQDFVPEVRGWLDRIEQPNLWGLFRHPVARAWHGPHSVLLGDAAHPTLPFMAQGANLALEDAWLLAIALDQDGDRLARYQMLREERVHRAVEAANANARNYHLSGARRLAGHAALRVAGRLAPELLAGRYRWLYDYDVTSIRV